MSLGPLVVYYDHGSRRRRAMRQWVGLAPQGAPPLVGNLGASAETTSIIKVSGGVPPVRPQRRSGAFLNWGGREFRSAGEVTERTGPVENRHLEERLSPATALILAWWRFRAVGGGAGISPSLRCELGSPISTQWVLPPSGRAGAVAFRPGGAEVQRSTEGGGRTAWCWSSLNATTADDPIPAAPARANKGKRTCSAALPVRLRAPDLSPRHLGEPGVTAQGERSETESLEGSSPGQRLRFGVRTGTQRVWISGRFWGGLRH